MNLNVTQKNLHLFLPSKVSRMVDIVSETEDISVVAAIKKVYRSETYRRLENENTKFWHLGPVTLCQELKMRG